MTDGQSQPEASLRVDKWLWFARFFKSRNLATKLVQGRKVRLNSQIIAKPSVVVKQGDILTFPQAKEIRVIKILELGARRGPAPEAQLLYEDLAPKELNDPKSSADEKPGKPGFERERGSGRPTKADRRALDKLRQNSENEF